MEGMGTGQRWISREKGVGRMGGGRSESRGTKGREGEREENQLGKGTC